MSELRERVAARLAEIAPGGELTGFERMPGGHSGITCLATIAQPSGEFDMLVVKAAPPGRPPVGRHDVLRQARVLTWLTAAGTVRVPEVVVQDDAGGEPYFAMRWHAGESVEPVLDPSAHLTEQIVTARTLAAADALADLHRAPVPDEPRLTPRQEVERWKPTMETLDAELRRGSDALEAALLDSAPDGGGPAIVHGDFRLGNTLCSDGVVNVVIDWEIWSVGDPRVDLGWLVLFCDPQNFPGVGHDAAGIPGPEVLRARYEQALGAPVIQLEWFEALARYKMAAIMGNNLARHRSGRYADPFQERLGPTIRNLIESAAKLVS